MKIRVTMKSPDALSDAISDCISNNFADLDKFEKADKRDELYSACSHVFQYGEYLTVEIDTETGDAVVIPPR